MLLVWTGQSHSIPNPKIQTARLSLAPGLPSRFLQILQKQTTLLPQKLTKAHKIQQERTIFPTFAPCHGEVSQETSFLIKQKNEYRNSIPMIASSSICQKIQPIKEFFTRPSPALLYNIYQFDPCSFVFFKGKSNAIFFTIFVFISFLCSKNPRKCSFILLFIVVFPLDTSFRLQYNMAEDVIQLLFD